jgi:hypothetical protein
LLNIIENFGKLEKQITRYFKERKDLAIRSKCRKLLHERIERLNSSWDMQVSGFRKNNRRNQSQSHFMGQLDYALVKEQMLVKRSIFTANFRGDPLYSLRGIGNTPDENAINMQDLLESNNEQTKFRPNVLIPGINQMIKTGTAVIYTEYCHNEEKAWRTISDPILGSRRVHGVIKNTKNAVSYPIDVRNYLQNPNIVDEEDSDYRTHIERWKFSKLMQRIKSNPDLYIKENVEKVIKEVKQQHGFLKDKDYFDAQGRETHHDFDKIAINDVWRGQIQIHLEGNEDDATYYYFEMVGDWIIGLQDNPYDMNMNQYTIWLCESREDYYWGNTPPEYSVKNENTLNLLCGLGVENALESMKRYIFYNKNAINPSQWNRIGSNAKIPVDVNKDINLGNILYQYQPQETALPAIQNAYRLIMENNQRVITTPDLNRAPSQGGPSNKTAYAADIMASVGNTQDADILEVFSTRLVRTGEKHIVILAQFLGNWGPILIRPSQRQAIREVQKSQITGDYQCYIDTALQKTDQNELRKYQDLISWLANLTGAGVVQPEFEPLVRQVLKMGKVVHSDRVLPEQDQLSQMNQMVPGVVPQMQAVAQ